MENRGLWTRLVARCFGGATAIAVLTLVVLAAWGGLQAFYAIPEQLVLQLLPAAGLVALPLIALGDKFSRGCGFGESMWRAAQGFAQGALLGAAILAVALLLLTANESVYAVFKPM